MSLVRPPVRDDRGHEVEIPLTVLWRMRWASLFLFVLAEMIVLLMMWTHQVRFGIAMLLHCVAFGSLLFILVSVKLDERPMCGRCPRCKYPLACLEPEPDGCTVCPECGAAWRLPEEGTEARRHEGTEG